MFNHQYHHVQCHTLDLFLFRDTKQGRNQHYCLVARWAKYSSPLKLALNTGANTQPNTAVASAAFQPIPLPPSTMSALHLANLSVGTQLSPYIFTLSLS